ncbi:hypothetical protein X805_04630 [Sphaerotilus natans subsp. natans DSM 6575]|uniref:Uncharacterized protein n=1 Tax=Sphaerotilus natans subsp. natans DSM 6575 TaxID=1286631 RepID=A0A059KRP5_9BURK|nr:hypothetical protein [Sphaerotilus natans]KDB53909.1 hypothetical protein X805_04630 [Sphaerotilus natans subsp. natans DSM 6575]SIR68596.1 hypothetical protein SAMN05421778_11492 [Sphaerotilus natans]
MDAIAQHLLDQAKARLLTRATGPARMTPSISLVPRQGLRVVGRLQGDAVYRQTTDGRPSVHVVVDQGEQHAVWAAIWSPTRPDLEPTETDRVAAKAKAAGLRRGDPVIVYALTAGMPTARGGRVHIPLNAVTLIETVSIPRHQRDAE